MATVIVALTDFEERPYRIPNQNEAKDLLAFLEAREDRILQEVLGYPLKKALLTGLAADPVVSKWSDLRDGGEYDYNGKTYKYTGLKKILVPRLYSMWLTETRDKFTDLGVVYNLSEQNEHISPSRRIVESYNEYARLVGDTYNQEHTLFGYLVANISTYTEWEEDDSTNPERINEFGI